MQIKFNSCSRFYRLILGCILGCGVFLACGSAKNAIHVKEATPTPVKRVSPLITGAGQMEKYLPYLRGKNIALVVNQTSTVGSTHLVDTLLASGIRIKRIFAPEHGFRGDAEAGEYVANSMDPATGLPLVSLYGKNKKPLPASLDSLDIVLFDIQDVGARFYTYISTLHYVMEACAEKNIELMVLDRPNPNGFYVDGPILQKEHSSFVGMHPVPIVHGMTIGEYARMINGEKWLSDSMVCKLRIVKVKNYTHNRLYEVPVKPSPNLPNAQSVYLYPSLCLFEGTVISLARGTEFPFQAIGHPKIEGPFSFTPRSIPGMSKNPPYENEICKGLDLRNFDPEYFVRKKRLNLSWLIDFYTAYPEKEKFFIPFFEKLSGTSRLREQIQAGMNEEEIRKSWEPALKGFKETRKKYLLYRD